MSRARTALACWAAGSWAWAVAVAASDRRHARRLSEWAPLEGGELVSVVVPARNESGRIGPALRSLRGQHYRDLEVIVVDDESTDGTLAEARAHEDDRIRVVEGSALSPGWVGKSWAIHQGVRRARGRWLLFTDADVIHAPDAVGSAVAAAGELAGGGLTLLCRLDSESPAERLVQPAAAVLIRSFIAPGPVVRSRRSPVAVAAGGFILVRREAYDRAGGHEAIRGAVVDDLSLARRLKALGLPLAVVDGHDAVSVRMYHGGGEVWRGWRKNASLGVAEGSPALAVAAAGAAAGLATVPAWAAARGPRLVGVAALALQLLARAAVDEIAPTPRRYWTTLPVGCLFLAAVSVVASLDRLNGGAVWRGRRYARE